MFDVLGQTSTPCGNGTVVPNPTSNTELVADCEVLWGLKDTLRGTATLNWNATTVIWNWNGISVSSPFAPPRRVRTINFNSHPLNGTLPRELGQLSNLAQMNIRNTSLHGSIPPELGQLSNLTHLQLGNNSLTGSIPPQLGNLSNLSHLLLSNNSLTGSIPPQLGNLSNLTELQLANNRLSGEFPLWVENLGSFRYIGIQGNLLTGHLPLEYPFPASMSRVVVTLGVSRVGSATIGGGNMFIGCIPSWATANSAVHGRRESRTAQLRLSPWRERLGAGHGPRASIPP